MNKLSTDDAGKLKDELYQVIQQAPRRMKEFEIEEAVTMAYKQALGIPVEVELVKHYPTEDPKPIRVFGINTNPEDCVIKFFRDRGADSVIVKEELKGSEEYPWGFYVAVDGTSCKASGTYINGYAVLTWWK